VRFDHLDDDAPVEPTDELRDAVVRRAARHRRRRALVPGAALLAIAAVAVAFVATAGKDDGTTRVLTPAAPPAGRVHLSAHLTPHSAEVRLDNATGANHQGNIEVCVASSKSRNSGGVSARSDARSCTQQYVAVNAHTSSTRTVLISTDSSATITVSWHDSSEQPVRAPSLRFRPVSGETLSARIALDRRVFAAGERITGSLVIENRTGVPVELRDQHGCAPSWGVRVGAPGVATGTAFKGACGTRGLVVQPGEVRLPFVASTGSLAFGAGEYRATFVAKSPIEGLRVPAEVAFRIG
jgi:hypothetical protein